MMQFHIEGVGLCGPGLNGWPASLPILAGTQAYEPMPARVPQMTLLPANERRRSVQTVRLALAVGTEAFAASGHDPASTSAVFASSGGDGETINQILEVLALPDRALSPTRFHNSVHNTPAGYWSIGTGSKAASSSLCCYDDSFAAGLLEAATQATMDQRPVALIAYDVQYPYPLSAVRPIGAAFAVALVLSPVVTVSTLASVRMRLGPGSAASVIAAVGLEALRQGTPAARSLPLLVALAAQAETEIVLNYLDDMALTLDIMPIQDGPTSDGGNSEP
jgi:hypothetical protein